jgi:hypothetical protein
LVMTRPTRGGMDPFARWRCQPARSWAMVAFASSTSSATLLPLLAETEASHRTFVLLRPTGFNRADAIHIRIPIDDRTSTPLPKALDLEGRAEAGQLASGLVAVAELHRPDQSHASSRKCHHHTYGTSRHVRRM